MSFIAEKKRTGEILDCVGDAVLTTNLELEVTYINRTAEILIGIKQDEAIGCPLQQILRVVDADTRQPRGEELARQAIKTNTLIPLENNALLINQFGCELSIEDSAAPLHDLDGTVIGAVIVFHDSCYSSEIRTKMADLARHDPLTGLFNRYAFDERFQQSMELARRHKKRVGLLFIDLDNFKDINDILGHATGDALLKALASRILNCLRSSDTACRYGGDEFVILLNEIEQLSDALMVAKKAHALAAKVLLPDGQQVAVHLSIGVSIYPDDGETLEMLLQQADMAMYRNKTLKKRNSQQGLPSRQAMLP
ncbi:diguanylate cyclase domain-containing protein [Marinospirillum sp.]|uniref:sensor domain-containing protein n=1 Tax=Marinospirillum sp. TaxID=2183934 RepID=UPI00287088A7|nr:diguanylate cyclase [Marinospirillum sp.]MDR9468130.1 diguanylate cyclase [Marinospirillum sp.]